MKLPLRKRFQPIIEVDIMGGSTEWMGLQQFIAQCYSLKSFEITECSNATYYRFEVSSKLDDYEKVQAEKSIARGYCPICSLDYVLNKMVADKFIQEGIYLLSMFW